MAKILFGGPQEKERGEPSTIHDNLVAKLKTEGHEVDYVTRGDDMMVGLLPVPLAKSPRYQLVIYDTGLFYDKAKPISRAQLFRRHVIENLRMAHVPVIVLAEKEMDELIRDSVEKAGFKQIKQPYKINNVVKEINSSL